MFLIRKLCVVFFWTLAGCVFFSTTEYSDYYVGPDGSDSTGDGSSVRPWRHIQYALNATRLLSDATIPRINIAPGDYAERLIIRRSVFIKGAGSDQVSIESPAAGREHVIDIQGPGGVRLEGLTVDGQYNQHRGILVNGAGFRANDITVYKPGVHGIDIVESGLFDIQNSRVDTDGLYRADIGIYITGSNGNIEGFYGGDSIDHIINIIDSTVTIKDAELVGSDIWYADGIRIQSPSKVKISDSTLRRPADAAIPAPGEVHNPPYAGIEVAYGFNRKSVVVNNCQISGFNTGIGINMIGNRLRVENTTLSGNRSEGVLTFARAGRPSPTVDFGGGALSSSGNNTFGTAEPIAFRNNATYDVSARGNHWGVPTSRINERIHDQRDDSTLGRVRY